MPRTALPVTAAILLACSASGPTPPSADPARRATVPAAEAPRPAPPAAATSTGDTGRDAPRRYACNDGSAVSVAWGDAQALIAIADDHTVTLPKAQSASKGGGEVFVGDTVSLQREGVDIELFQGAGAALQCRPAAAAE
jgi:hypothetical protein